MRRLQDKLRTTVSSNGLVTHINDNRTGRRVTAEVWDCASSGYNVRIEKRGKPFKCMRLVSTDSPMAAYEVCWVQGVRWDAKRECWEDE